MSETRLTRVGRESIKSQAAYTFYKERSKYRKVDTTPTLESHSKLVTAFYKKIGEKMLEKRGGVFIPGFGYFVILLNPLKKVVASSYKTASPIIINAHSNSMTYHPAFISTATDINMKPFVMDKYFNRELKRKLAIKIKSGVKFTNHFGLLLSIFKNKKR